MAGFIVDTKSCEVLEIIDWGFGIDTPNVAREIMARAPHKRVVTLQLDCDELDAVLWGLTHYRK